MKSVKFLFSLICGLFLFVSCVPEADSSGDLLHGIGNIGIGNGGGGNSGGGGDAPSVISNKVLSKIFTHTKDDTTGQWEDETTIFNYENKRLKSISVSGGDDITFEYNADGKISKIISSGFTGVYTYDAQKIASKLSIDIMGMSQIVTDFTYDSLGKISKMKNTSAVSFPIAMDVIREDVLSYNSNQVTKCISSYTVTPAGPDVPANVTSTYTYDNKISPFYTLPLAYNLFVISFGGANSYILSKNNLTKAVVISGINDTTNYTYEYDSEGYAVKGKNSGDGGYSTFEYIKL